MEKKKKIFTDMIINVVSSAIPVFLLQLVVYPLIAQKVSQEKYGNMITSISVIMVISASLGNVLNNVRLLLNDKYQEKGIRGDFNRILISFIIISTIVTTASLVILKVGTGVDILLSVVIGNILLIQGYAVVAFLIELNFRKVLMSNIWLSVGYIIGYAFFAWFHTEWQYIYIVGYLFSLIYIILNCTLLKEPVTKTEFFSNTTKECKVLLEASIVGNLLNYSDRIIINPIIGAEGVTIYYISTLFGKLIAQLIGPISGVILGYLAKIKSLEKKLENGMVFVTSVICIVGYFGCILLSRPILSMLYPEYFGEALKYIPITTATAMFTTMASAISPFVLKFCSRQWQVLINVVTLLSYVLGSLMGYRLCGMTGFCIGVLLSFVMKTMLLLFILKHGKSIEEKV